MPLFDAYLVVDWSAASVPRHGRDSIWLGLTVRRRGKPVLARLENPTSRAAATTRIGDLLAGLLRRGRRVLAGFDFPFGYPAGTARRLGLIGTPWRHTWQELDELLADGADNRNNRFEVAEGLNRRLSGEPFPFWGHGGGERPFLLRCGRRPHGPDDLPERRLCERRIPRVQPTWKLAGNGSVGGQMLTGIPRVWQLRRDPRIALDAHVWPFETGLAHDPHPAIVFAEVYPSLVPPLPLAGQPKDAGQVAALGARFAELDAAGRLGACFAGDPGLTAAEREAVECEEAWILGVTDGGAP